MPITPFLTQLGCFTLLDSANEALIELKRQVQAGEPRGRIDRTVEQMELLVGASYPLVAAP
jgi:hypothetical protein